MMKEDFKLNDVPKRNIYQVPDDYFDRLPVRIMERTAARESVEVETGKFMWWRLLRTAVASVMMLAFFVGVFFYSNKIVQEQSSESYALSDVPEHEIVEYLNFYASLETADFAELPSLSQKPIAAEFLNVSSKAAEAELEYYRLEESNF